MKHKLGWDNANDVKHTNWYKNGRDIERLAYDTYLDYLLEWRDNFLIVSAFMGLREGAIKSHAISRLRPDEFLYNALAYSNVQYSDDLAKLEHLHKNKYMLEWWFGQKMPVTFIRNFLADAISKQITDEGIDKLEPYAILEIALSVTPQINQTTSNYILKFFLEEYPVVAKKLVELYGDLK